MKNATAHQRIREAKKTTIDRQFAASFDHLCADFPVLWQHFGRYWAKLLKYPPLASVPLGQFGIPDSLCIAFVLMLQSSIPSIYLLYSWQARFPSAPRNNLRCISIVAGAA